MKLLYTLGTFVYSGHQVLFYTINNKNENTEEYQKLAEHTFAASFGPKNNMFSDFENVEGMDAEPPETGDVIWTHTSGNQYIATGIWRETPDGPIDFNALRLICKSVSNKAISLGQKYVSMPLITEDLDIWNFVYPIIEESFDDSVQVIVHIPTEEQILAVLESIGGEINAFESNHPTIRFAQSSDD